MPALQSRQQLQVNPTPGNKEGAYQVTTAICTSSSFIPELAGSWLPPLLERAKQSQASATRATPGLLHNPHQLLPTFLKASLDYRRCFYSLSETEQNTTSITGALETVRYSFETVRYCQSTVSTQQAPKPCQQAVQKNPQRTYPWPLSAASRFFTSSSSSSSSSSN